MRRGSKHTKEAREKIGKAGLGRISANKGKKFSKEWKEKLSLSHLGNKHTPETCAKMSISKSKENNPNWKGGQTKAERSWQKNYWHRRRSMAEGSHTFQEWEELKAQCNWTCLACRKREPEIKLTLDHIIPLSKGGSENIENIQPLCKNCNCQKHTKTIRYKYRGSK
jgi:hypothetical protein|tara:strand:+ start:89 stop:589 length:501 start_codon:yes stop_codon:yes gene_type:complete